PLTSWHEEMGARMVGFAGYRMPLNYREGIVKEHLWTRERASLFDVSHMGPAWLKPTERPDALDHAAAAALLEPLVCGDIAGLPPGRLRYTLLMSAAGGVRDDLMIGRPDDEPGSLFLVANAAVKEADFAAISKAAGEKSRLVRADDGALLAVQGPMAAEALEPLIPGVSDLIFMDFAKLEFEGEPVRVSRSGYTGEDGFEVLVSGEAAVELASRLVADELVRPAGLGARDTLRLEAGLPLFGHDMDEEVSPIEAGLAFAVSRRRLKALNFPGAARAAREMEEGPAKLRLGLKVLAGAPAREGAPILNPAAPDSPPIGKVTSGGFSPSLSAPIAMGFAPPAFAAPGTPLLVEVRGRRLPAEAASLPFFPHRYRRGPSKEA
ncbi:MAG: glycine cleavage system aminomethyltransferase GcvT, partial [Caulobacteraceae bacterium]